MGSRSVGPNAELGVILEREAWGTLGSVGLSLVVQHGGVEFHQGEPFGRNPILAVLVMGPVANKNASVFTYVAVPVSFCGVAVRRHLLVVGHRQHKYRRNLNPSSNFPIKILKMIFAQSSYIIFISFSNS